MSFLKKFQRSRKSSESGSIGSTLSIQSIGTNKVLLSTTYSVNEKELPPFLKAVWRNDMSKVKKLMKKNYGCVDKEQRSGLHLACAMGSDSMVRELLGNYGNELLEKADNRGRTGLFKAVETGAFECVRLLLEKGAKTDVRDMAGDTVLHAAVIHKHLEILKHLLSVNCNGNILNNEGLGPLHLASSAGYIDGIDALLQHDVYIDQLTSSGKSALILAAESGNFNVIKELLTRSADINICDNNGKDAYYYADFHQYTDCAQQLLSIKNFNKSKTPPRKAAPLQMPEFIISASSPLAQSSPKPNPRNQHSKDDVKMQQENRESKKTSTEKRERNGSILSENSWSGDFSHYSSDTTLPNMKSQNLHDISTPSSMPNPSDNASDNRRPLANGISKTQLNKQLSEDEESQWTDTEGYNEPVTVLPDKTVKSNHRPKIISEIYDYVDGAITVDSDWDSDSEMGKHNADGNLSTIDEESGMKRTNNTSIPYSTTSKVKTPKMNLSDDGHHTDSNIEECYNSNYIILNKPVRYDSSETLEKSIDDDDDDTELSQTKIQNPNFREDKFAPFSKPPVSPMNRGEGIPIITIEETSIKNKVTKNVSGDNLSYSSTDISSRRESLAGSDYQAETKYTEEYIKRCSDLESKLRLLESEMDILKQDNRRVTEMKTKLESEKIKLQKDYQRTEISLSEKKDELDEYKSRFIISEDLLKTREKELFDVKKANQDLSGNISEMEMKNLAYDSKIKQLQQEITNLHSDLQRSVYPEKDVETSKSEFDSERNIWLRKNEELNAHLADLQQQISRMEHDSDKIITEQNVAIEKHQTEINDLKRSIKENKEDDLNRIEEIEQLKKTIKNLNADLESSNKSAAIVAKEEQKNKILSEKLKAEETKVEELSNDNQAMNKQIIDNEKSYNNIKQELERLRKQLTIKDDNLSQVELKYISSENQAKDLEKLLQEKVIEVKELNKKCIEIEEDLISERNKKDNLIERVNLAINSAISQCPGSEEVLEQLQNIRQSLTGADNNNGSKNLRSLPTYQDNDSSIELSKARSQIRVLQDELDSVRRDLKQSIDEVIVPRQDARFQSSGPIDRNYERELDRVDKIERMEKDNKQDLNEQGRLLRKTQQQMEVSELNQILSRVEKDRDELLQEVKVISEQLLKERNLKDSLTEQLVNIMRNPNGSIQLMSGSKDFMFPSTTAINTVSSQWNIPNNVGETDRKPFSTSMSNLTMQKTNGTDDDELRQRMRKELDRSIAKHLESGRPLRQLNVKDKIRSLNIVRYPNSNGIWTSQ